MKSVWLLGMIAVVALVGCGPSGEEKYKMTDAELHLTPQQAEGRQLYNQHCLQCHEAYTTKKRVSFSMKGLFAKPEMPSGIPANDERVGEVILRGKRMMPGTPINGEQVQALVAYMHTL